MKKLFKLSLKFVLVTWLISCSNPKGEKVKNIEFEKLKTVEKDLKTQLIDEFGAYSEDANEDNKRLNKVYNKVLKLWKTPFLEIDIPTRYGNAHVIVSGPKEGKKLVLLHGLNATSTMWYPNIAELSKNHRVFAIDFLLDPGKSDYNKNAESVNAVMLWHDEIFQKLKLDTFSLIGASRGGWLATEIAINRKYSVENLVLLSPAQTFIWMPPSVDMVKNVNYSFNAKRKKFRGILETLSSNVDGIDQKFIDLHFMVTKNAEIGKFMFQMRPFSADNLKKISCPILLLIGDNDLFNNQKSVNKANDLIPNVKTKIIHQAGHFLSIDQASVVNREVLEFIRN